MAGLEAGGGDGPAVRAVHPAPGHAHPAHLGGVTTVHHGVAQCTTERHSAPRCSTVRHTVAPPQCTTERITAH